MATPTPSTSQNPNTKPSATQDAISALKTLRDELRVQAHLGGIEAKEAWRRIEPHFDALEKEAAQAGVITVRAVSSVFGELGKLIGQLRKS